MRTGFKGSTTRLVVMLGLVLIALALIAVPLANAAPTTGPVVVGINAYGTFYGGAKLMPTHVVFKDATYTFATVDTIGVGTFVAAIELPLPSYSDAIVATGTATNFTDTTVPVSVHYYDTEGSANVVVKLPVKTTTVSGTVTNAKTKKAIKGVKVTVGNKTAKTNAKGRYLIVIGLWPATKYRATFAWTGHKKATTTFTSAPGGSRTVNKSLK